MKKKNVTRRRRNRVILDFRICVVAVGAIAVLQLLVFFAGWVAGQHAVEPMRQVAPVVQVASLVPRPSSLATEAPIQLVFEALPPLERPKPFERPMPQNFTPDFYVELIRDAALQHDVPAALVQAVVKVESDFNARAVSPKGARGLMQVMPATARRFGVANPDHLFYPAPNLNAGTAYLAWLLKRYDGNLDLVLAAYNAGEGAVATYRGIPPYRETRNYVKKVRQALGRNAA